MRRESGEVIEAIYRWVKKNRDSATEALTKTAGKIAQVNLAGKVKAYQDVVCFIQDRYGKKIKLPKDKKKES